jgi:NADH-quinone oxidoreductase subunit E
MDQEEEMLKDIGLMLEGFQKDRSELIPILQAIQRKYSYLSPKAVRLTSDYLDMGEGEVYGVATFYNQFKFNTPGKHQIRVCLGTACHVKGGEIVLEHFERTLGIKDGETTPDREFSIERLDCVGCCSLAPVAIIDKTIQGNMAPSKVEGIFLGYRLEKDKEQRRKTEDETSK